MIDATRDLQNVHLSMRKSLIFLTVENYRMWRIHRSAKSLVPQEDTVLQKHSFMPTNRQPCQSIITFSHPTHPTLYLSASSLHEPSNFSLAICIHVSSDSPLYTMYKSACPVHNSKHRLPSCLPAPDFMQYTRAPDHVGGACTRFHVTHIH